MDWQSRTRLLLGEEKLKKLAEKHVLVAGLGGVGAYAAEMLCRAGVGTLTIVDADVVQPSNRNRQLPALSSTQGQSKAELMGARLKDINPEINLTVIKEYLRDEKLIDLMAQKFDYVVDAIDTLSPKVFLMYYAVKNNQRIVSSMGAGGKLDPQQVKIADIADSYNCKLAYTIRKRLRKLDVSTGIKVIFSTEQVPKERIELCDNELNKKSVVGTISYMPPVFGCFCASVVIQDLTEL